MKTFIKSLKLLWANDETRNEMKKDFKRLFIANILAIIAIAVLSQCLPRPLITYINVIAVAFAMNFYEFSIIYKNAVLNYCARL